MCEPNFLFHPMVIYVPRQGAEVRLSEDIDENVTFTNEILKYGDINISRKQNETEEQQM